MGIVQIHINDKQMHRTAVHFLDMYVGLGHALGHYERSVGIDTRHTLGSEHSPSDFSLRHIVHILHCIVGATRYRYGQQQNGQ